jgi:hypothetical protein
MNELAFVPGLELAASFYRDAVQPILGPGVRHSAALIGSGSEVLGLDDEMSRDHHWGPRVMLFLEPVELDSKWPDLSSRLAEQLPRSHRGYSTNFTPPDPLDNGTQLMQHSEHGPINHRVEAYSIAGFFTRYLAIDPEAELDTADWLSLPQHKLRAVTAGAVFHDDLGLDVMRTRLSWYPHDVWLYLLACGWRRIAQEEHLMGRAGLTGDEIGSALIGSRLVRDIMRLAFLMEKRYAPYPKWFGTAFRSLTSAKALQVPLEAALRARSWGGREKALCKGYRVLVEMHNALGITATLSEDPTRFHHRPFNVIHGDRFTEAILERIVDPSVKKLHARRIGSIDLFSDSTDLLDNPRLRPGLAALFD